MKIKLITFTFLALFACTKADKTQEYYSPTPESEVQHNLEATQFFLNVLNTEYLKVAQSLKLQGFKKDAIEMEDKSKFALKRDATYFTEASFPLMGKKYDEIQLARLFLEKLRGNTLIFKYFPESIARMQVYYDCMVLEYRDEYTKPARNFCTNQFDIIQKGFQRTGFTKNIKYGESRETFIIYFDLGSAEIKSEFYNILSDITKKTKSMSKYSINIVGLADKTSTRQVNIEISRKRAENVKNTLVRMGVNASQIQTQHHADELPIVETEKPEKFNRRVLIDLIGE
jgi:outer membrane protein OmpA-like peptidoglycan-associated protein